MATTAGTAREVHNWPYLLTEVNLTTVLPGETLDVSHGGPSGVKPEFVLGTVTVEATSGDSISTVEHIRGSDNTTNNTARLRVKAPAGADLTGATVRVLFFFTAQASGGIGS
jgi:hypothetical protein